MKAGSTTMLGHRRVNGICGTTAPVGGVGGAGRHDPAGGARRQNPAPAETGPDASNGAEEASDGAEKVSDQPRSSPGAAPGPQPADERERKSPGGYRAQTARLLAGTRPKP
jgi:hypothetical protein